MGTPNLGHIKKRPSNEPLLSSPSTTSPTSTSSTHSTSVANNRSFNNKLSLNQTFDSPTYDTGSNPATPQTMFRKNALGVALDESKRYEDSIVSLTDALDLVSEEARKAKDELELLRQENKALRGKVAEISDLKRKILVMEKERVAEKEEKAHELGVTLEERRKRDHVIIEMSDRIKVLTDENAQMSTQMTPPEDVRTLREEVSVLKAANQALENEMKTKELEVSTQANEFEAQLHVIEAQNAEADIQQNKIDSLERQLEAKNDDLNEVTKLKEEISELKEAAVEPFNKIQELTDEVVTHLDTIESLRVQLSVAKTAPPPPPSPIPAPQAPIESGEECNELRHMNSELTTQLDTLNQLYEGLSEKFDAATAEIKLLQKEDKAKTKDTITVIEPNKELQEAYDELQSKYQASQDTIFQQHASYEELEEKYEELLSQQFSTDDEQLKKDYGDLLVSHTNLETEISRLSSSNKSLERANAELSVRAARGPPTPVALPVPQSAPSPVPSPATSLAPQKSAEFQDLNEAHSSLAADHATLLSRHEELRLKHTSLKKRSVENEHQIEMLTKQLDDASKVHVSSSAASSEELQSLQEKHAALTADHDALVSEHTSLKNHSIENEYQIEILTKQLDETSKIRITTDSAASGTSSEELKSLQEKHAALTAQHEVLKNRSQKNEYQIDILTKQLDDASKIRISTSVASAASSEELQSLQEKHAALTADHDALVSEHEELHLKHTSLSSSMETRIEVLTKQLDNANKQRTNATIASAASSGSFLGASSVKRLRSMQEEEMARMKKSFSTQVEKIQSAHGSQLETLNEALEASNRENERVDMELKMVEMQHDNLSNMYEGLQEELGEERANVTRITSELQRTRAKADSASAAVETAKQAEINSLKINIDKLNAQIESLRKQNKNLSMLERNLALNPATPPQQKLLQRQKIELENDMYEMQAHYEGELKAAKEESNLLLGLAEDEKAALLGGFKVGTSELFEMFNKTIDTTNARLNYKLTMSSKKISSLEAALSTLRYEFSANQANLRRATHNLKVAQAEVTRLRKREVENGTRIEELTTRVEGERAAAEESRDLAALAYATKAGNSDKQLAAALTAEVSRCTEVQLKRIEELRNSGARDMEFVKEDFENAMVSYGEVKKQLEMTIKQNTCLEKRCVMAEGRLNATLKLASAHGAACAVVRTELGGKTREMELWKGRAEEREAENQRLQESVAKVGEDYAETMRGLAEQIRTSEARRISEVASAKKKVKRFENEIEVLHQDTDDVAQVLDGKLKSKEDQLALVEEGMGGLVDSLEAVKEENVGLRVRLKSSTEEARLMQEENRAMSGKLEIVRDMLEVANRKVDLLEEAENDNAAKSEGLVKMSQEIEHKWATKVEDLEAKLESLKDKKEMVGEALEIANQKLDIMEEEYEDLKEKCDILKQENAGLESVTRSAELKKEMEIVEINNELTAVVERRSLLENERAFMQKTINELRIELERLKSEVEEGKRKEVDAKEVNEMMTSQIDEMKQGAALSKTALEAAEKFWEESEEVADNLRDDIEELNAEKAKLGEELTSAKQEIFFYSNEISIEKEKRLGLERLVIEIEGRNEDLKTSLDEERVKVIGLIQEKNTVVGKRRSDVDTLSQDLEVSRIEVATLSSEVDSYKSLISELREKVRSYECVAESKSLDLADVQEQNRLWRLRNVKFVAEIAAVESRRMQAEKEREVVRSEVEGLKEQIRLMQCSSRQYGTPVKGRDDSYTKFDTPVVTKVVETEEYAMVVEDNKELRQRTKKLKFELQGSEQARNAAVQRAEKLEVLLGEKNESLLKAFHKDAVVEELKSALHTAYEKLEHEHNTLSEAERDRSELQRQLDESVESQLYLEQSVGELKVEKGQLETRLRMMDGEISMLRDRVGAVTRQGEETARVLVEDIRERLRLAEGELEEERERREEVKASAEKKVDAAEVEKKKLRAKLVRVEGERDEARIRAEEAIEELNSVREQSEELKKNMKSLSEVNEKNMQSLKIEANRRLLEARLLRSPLLTPGRFRSREDVSTPKVVSTPKSVSTPKALSTPMPKGVDVGSSPMSAFTSFVSIGVSPMAPLEEDMEIQDVEEGARLEIAIEEVTAEAKKWRDAAGSLQVALDSAVASRDSLIDQVTKINDEKAAILSMYEKEKITVRNELKAAFAQAKYNRDAAAETTFVIESNEKNLKIVTGELDLSRKQNGRLRENMEKLGEEFRKVVAEKNEVTTEIFSLKKSLQVLRAKADDALSEREYLVTSIQATEERAKIEKEAAEREIGRLERGLDEIEHELQEVKAQKQEVEVVEKVVEVEKIVEVEKVVERLAGGGEVMIEALKAELAERDIQLQKMRKEVKEGAGATSWHSIRPREVRDGRRKARGNDSDSDSDSSDSSNNSGSISENRTIGARKNARKAKEISRAFGKLSKRLTMG